MDWAWSCSACSLVTFCSVPQNVHCVAYLVEMGNSGTKNSVNFVTRFLSVCAAGLPQPPHTSVSIASWYRYPLVPKMITRSALLGSVSAAGWKTLTEIFSQIHPFGAMGHCQWSSFTVGSR